MRIITGQVIRSTHNKDCENICRVHNNIIGHDSFCNGKGTVKLVPSARDFNKILLAYYCYCLMMCLLHAKVSMFQFINSRYERKQCGASQIISYTQCSIVNAKQTFLIFFEQRTSIRLLVYVRMILFQYQLFQFLLFLQITICIDFWQLSHTCVLIQEQENSKQIL